MVKEKKCRQGANNLNSNKTEASMDWLKHSEKQESCSYNKLQVAKR